jgi:cytochrome b6
MTPTPNSSGSQPAAPPPRRGALAWLDSRYGLGPLLEFMRHKEVPLGAHSMVWFYLGGTTLFFFITQIASGVLLLVYYQPGEATSYESIRYLTTKVPFGWLVRSIHCWSAHLMIVSLVAHMFSTMMLKAYRPPRELTWVTGFILFAVALGFGFSGYLLPWNELSFFATAVGTDSVKSVPLVGHWLLEVLRGGPDVTINTLYRFFALHVVVLPLTALALIGVHLLFIQRQGMAPPLVGSPLAPAYPGIKPEWYFLWVYQLLKEFPPHLMGLEGPQAALLVVTVLLAIWAAVPWMDRSAAMGKSSAAFSDFGISALYVIGYLTLKAWDIGGGGREMPDAIAVARTCSFWSLGVMAVVTAVRVRVHADRFFAFTVGVAAQIVLHGFLQVSYLAASAIGLVVAVAAFLVMRRPSARAPAPAGDSA